MAQLTTQQAADKLGITRARIHQLMAAGRLKARRSGPVWVIEERDLKAVADRKADRAGWRANRDRPAPATAERKGSPGEPNC